MTCLSMKKQYKNATTVKVENLEFEVNHRDLEIFHIERSKEARKNQLKQFIYCKLSKRWMEVPKNLAVMERKYINDLLDSI